MVEDADEEEAEARGGAVQAVKAAEQPGGARGGDVASAAADGDDLAEDAPTRAFLRLVEVGVAHQDVATVAHRHEAVQEDAGRRLRLDKQDIAGRICGAGRHADRIGRGAQRGRHALSLGRELDGLTGGEMAPHGGSPFGQFASASTIFQQHFQKNLIKSLRSLKSLRTLMTLVTLATLATLATLMTLVTLATLETLKTFPQNVTREGVSRHLPSQNTLL